jgi:uncharacterized membrane-anchored protein YhcB (DUF1043 family)
MNNDSISAKIQKDDQIKKNKTTFENFRRTEKKKYFDDTSNLFQKKNNYQILFKSF